VSRPRCAVLPRPTDDGTRGAAYADLVDALETAVREGGGIVTEVRDADAIVWTDARHPGDLRTLLDTHPGIRWVQLPWAGIEPFVEVLDHDRAWTCGKGVYAPPVAEHALAMLLAGFRHLVGYGRTRSWSDPVGRNLFDARVTILGGGEITRHLVDLLVPFRVQVTVVRNRPSAMPRVHRVVGPAELHDALAGADAAVLALALTPETDRVLDADALAVLPDHAWVVNVARGRHVDTDDLLAALEAGTLGGAALDVTDPEPLPDGHPLWDRPEVLITPHVANTPEMGRALLATRVADNVRRFGAGDDLLGPVHVELGY
jgi:phosphoglycerate dehydrogenase-like enzyme